MTMDWSLSISKATPGSNICFVPFRPSLYCNYNIIHYVSPAHGTKGESSPKVCSDCSGWPNTSSSPHSTRFSDWAYTLSARLNNVSFAVLIKTSRPCLTAGCRVLWEHSVCRSVRLSSKTCFHEHWHINV